jgi:hypothetical protein
VNEDALRALVRDAVARHLGIPGSEERTPTFGSATDDGPRPTDDGRVTFHHASHFRYGLPGSGGACLIEPSVQCSHCGYCQSHGH